MQLRSGFDIYILPCLNGYGIYNMWKPNYTGRLNANGVNINRNMPVSDWVLSCEPFDQNYTGPYAGSEFESQLIIGLIDLIKPDIFIDHHNYSTDVNRQFYTDSSSAFLANAIFGCLIDCSHAFLKNMPQYFGNDFLIPWNGDMPGRTSVVIGDLQEYGYEQGITHSLTIEISNRILFLDGEFTTSNPAHTHDVFKVGEYTLRNHLVHLINSLPTEPTE
jgi:hypothetical protein